MLPAFQYPGAWATTQLRAALDSIQYGYTASAVPEKVGPKFLRITDLEGGPLNWSSIPHCICKKPDAYLLESGDLVIARTGATTGKSHLLRHVPEPAVFASYLIRLRCSPSLDAGFLNHFLQSSEYWRQICSQSYGTAQPGANASVLSKLIVPLPDLEEQQAIARILDAVDVAIERTRTAIATAERLKRGLMQQSLKRCAKSKAPIERLDQVAEIGSGVTLGRDLSGSATVELPYLRVANVQDGFLDLGEIKTVKVRPSEVERFALAEGDVLLTEGGDFDKLGRGAVWTGEISPCLHQNHIFRVRADRTKLEPHFLATLIGSEYGKRFFLRIAKRTTNLASINKTQLKSFPVILPDLKEQERIVRLIASANRLTESNEAKHRSLEKLKRGLMQDLLTGRVRVQLPAHSGNGAVRSRP